MKSGTKVKIVFVGKKDPNYVSPSGAPVGYLARMGRVGNILNDSPKYNSSFLVDFNGLVYDIHDQYFEYLPCTCDVIALHQNGCQCGGA